MGELGARLLAKALQTNCKLRSLVFDRNNITLQGYSDIAYAMNRFVKISNPRELQNLYLILNYSFFFVF